jgi:hypothetical protein
MVSLLLFLTAYSYDFRDWLNLPAMDQIVSITSDGFDGFVAVPNGVYQIGRIERRLKRTITRRDGIQGRVRAVGYDPHSGLLWVLSSGNLLSINTFSNVAFSYDLPSPGVNALGINSDHVFLADGSRHWSLDKKRGQMDTLSPGNRRVSWYGAKNPHQPSDYPFLVPYVFYDQQMNGHAITCVYPEGRRLWVGTDGYGVMLYSLASRLPLARWQFGPGSEQLETILRTGDEFWFTAPGALTRYTAGRDSWGYYETPFNAFFDVPGVLLRSRLLDLKHRDGIQALVGDTHEYWLGSGNYLYSYSPRANVLTQLLKLNSPVTSALEAGDSVLFGTADGLITFNRSTRKLTAFADTSRQMYFGVFGIGATSRRVYYAVHGGLETQDSLGQWELVIPPGFILSRHPNALAGARDRLFAASDQGVMVYDERTRSFSSLTTESGMLSNRVSSLYADEDYLWIVTDAGISRFNHHALFP